MRTATSPVQYLLQQAAAPATSDSFVSPALDRTYQASVAGSGAVSATVIIEGSNNDTDFLEIGTITLSGTTRASDGFASNARWAYVRARLTTIAGTNAAVNVLMGS